MKVILNKEQLIKEFEEKYEDCIKCEGSQSYEHEFDSDQELTPQEMEERKKETIDFINSLTEEKIIELSKNLAKKKNGKPRKSSVIHIFVGDIGYWICEWYVTYITYRIVVRAKDEDTVEVCFEDTQINGDEYPIVY